MSDKENKQANEYDIDFCLQQIKKIKDSMTDLDEHRKNALRFYRGDVNIVDPIEGRSQTVTTDLMDTIEWIKPSLLRIFTAGDEAVSLSPVGAEDAEKTKNMSLLVNHQMKVKNKWFLILNDWIDDMLKQKVGIVKYQWFTKKKVFYKEYNELTEIEYQAKIMEPNLEVVDVQQTEVKAAVFDTNPITMGSIPVSPAVFSYYLKVKYTLIDKYPLIEPVPPEDIGFSLDARDKEDMEFLWHRVRFNKRKFIQRYGKELFTQIENAKSEDDDSNDVKSERLKDLGGQEFYFDKDKKEYHIYECYYYKDDDIAWKKDICGEIELESVENKYDEPCFEFATPIKLAHRIAGLDLYDLLKEIQKIRTSLLRQIIDNAYFANNRRYFGDVTRMNLDDYLNNNVPNGLVRTEGDPRGIVMGEEKAPIAGEIFTLWETLNIEKDYHSPAPRSFQGTNSQALNQTWRGQAQQVTQASQRVEMIARIIAEMGLAPLTRAVVNMNIKFLDKATSVRYLNKWVEINPDNIISNCDIIVNVGLGTGNKDQIILYMQQLLGLYGQIYKAGIPIVTPQNAYMVMKELVSAMGYKNTADFVTDPKLIESVSVLLKMVTGITTQMGINDPSIIAAIQNVMNSIGISANMKDKGTQPNQETPEQPAAPYQPMQPSQQPMGNNFYG